MPEPSTIHAIFLLILYLCFITSRIRHLSWVQDFENIFLLKSIAGYFKDKLIACSFLCTVYNSHGAAKIFREERYASGFSDPRCFTFLNSIILTNNDFLGSKRLSMTFIIFSSGIDFKSYDCNGSFMYCILPVPPTQENLDSFKSPSR
ncbi:hypothetical protein RF11_02096 [Thelohanellus kitauei]|uniref:Uncharacterized protein n=1 Tax=Thelohanellus kitauei TaxID=669202 RepID=A0A0C2MH13_THEKT|nr:hypothetical protein RF11_02096 [Thelohanellus kitauei]